MNFYRTVNAVIMGSFVFYGSVYAEKIHLPALKKSHVSVIIEEAKPLTNTVSAAQCRKLIPAHTANLDDPNQGAKISPTYTVKKGHNIFNLPVDHSDRTFELKIGESEITINGEREDVITYCVRVSSDDHDSGQLFIINKYCAAAGHISYE
jgi:hypothetical protein